MGQGLDLEAVAPGAEAAFLATLDELLTAAQQAGTVRADVDVVVVKALLVVCKVPQAFDGAVTERVTRVIEDGLRA